MVNRASHKLNVGPAKGTDIITPPATEAPQTPRILPKENSFTTVPPDFVHASPKGKTPAKGSQRLKRAREDDDHATPKRAKAKGEDPLDRE
jgi:hypothetical protein